MLNLLKRAYDLLLKSTDFLTNQRIQKHLSGSNWFNSHPNPSLFIRFQESFKPRNVDRKGYNWTFFHGKPTRHISKR